jgi:hypothetical protein
MSTTRARPRRRSVQHARSHLNTNPPKFKFVTSPIATRLQHRGSVQHGQNGTRKSNIGSGSRRSSAAEHSIPRMPTAEEHVLDPFDSACIALDRDVHILLQYYAEVCHPNVWRTEHCLSASKDYQFKFTLMSIIKDCVQDQMNMYAILASMASQGCFMHHLVLRQKDAYFLHMALVIFRAYLAQATVFTDGLIFIMFHIGCAEFYSYHHEATLVHLRAIRRAVEERGGLTRINAALRELLILGDGYVAAEALLKPLLCVDGVLQLYEIPPEVRETYDAVLISCQTGSRQVGQRVLMPDHKLSISGHMKHQLLDLAVTLELLRLYSRETAVPGIRSSALHWLHARSLVIRHRLLCLNEEDPRAEVLRLTVVAWTLLTMSGAGRVRIVKGMAQKLRTMLEALKTQSWVGSKPLYLWILLTLAMCARGGSSEKHWLLSRIARFRSIKDGSVLIAWDEGGLAAFCEQVFFLENIQRPMVEGLIPLIPLAG